MELRKVVNVSALPAVDSPVLTLPRYAPFDEAAGLLGLSKEDLRRRVETGTIPAGMMPDGTLIVMIDETTPRPLAMEGAERPHAEEPEEKKPLDVLPLAVAGDDINARLAAIRREDFAHLEGKPITVSEAAEKYKVPEQTIRSWIKRYPNHIEILTPGYRKQVNEAAIAYFAAIYKVWKEHGIRPGTGGLVEETGKPALLKHPSMSRYRRSKRQRR